MTLPQSSVYSGTLWHGAGGTGGSNITTTVLPTASSIIYSNRSNMFVTSTSSLPIIQFVRDINLVNGCVYKLPNGKCLELKDGHLFIGELHDKATLVKVEDLEEIKQLIQLRFGEIVVKPGETSSVVMPDGSIIEISNDGNYVIKDKNANVTYKANRLNRDFNKFMNASDMLEEFINYVKTLDISQSEFLKLPIELFINWLIINACTIDGDIPPELPTLPAPTTCLHCNKIIESNKKIQFCCKEHMIEYWDEEELRQNQEFT